MDPIKRNPADGLRIDRDRALRNLIRSVSDLKDPGRLPPGEIYFRKRMDMQIVAMGSRHPVSENRQGITHS
jgi:hypothetical protein